MKVRYEHSSRLFYLSEQQDLLLFLIRKELLGTKLIMAIEGMELENAIYYDIELGKMILWLLGYERCSDELWEQYLSIIKSYAQDLTLGNNTSAFEQTYKAYFELKRKLM